VAVFMAKRKRRGPPKTVSKNRRGGARPGSGRKPVLNNFQMAIIGGECEQRWKAATVRRAKEKHEAAIPDFEAVRELQSKAKGIVRGTGRQRIGRIRRRSKESFEAFDAEGDSLGLYRTGLEAANKIKRAALDLITYDIDVEM
jgi:hypothetical protein